MAATSNNIGVVTMFNLPHQNSSTPCHADFNGNGKVEVTDLLNLIAYWGSDNEDADLNDDGVVNVLDLLDLLDLIGAWGSCPE